MENRPLILGGYRISEDLHDNTAVKDYLEEAVKTRKYKLLLIQKLNEIKSKFEIVYAGENDYIITLGIKELQVDEMSEALISYEKDGYHEFIRKFKTLLK